MQLKSLLLLAVGATSVLAAPTPDLLGDLLGAIPGFPLGNGFCLSDQQASYVVAQFKSILTNPNRKAAAATANALLDSGYTETSDSINVLDGTPQGQVSFNSKQAFISGVTGAPAIPSMTNLDIIHSCDRIMWQWLANGIALNKSPVKGFNKLMVDPRTGIVKSNELEFNSIAWGRDLGWTCTPPPQ